MLHIAKAQLEDSGPYMCQLNTDPMKTQIGVLDVIIEPDIVDDTGPTTVLEGKMLGELQSIIELFYCPNK